MPHPSRASLPTISHRMFFIDLIRRWQADVKERLHCFSSVFRLMSVLALSTLLTPDGASAAPLSLGSASLNAEYHVTLYTGGTITCRVDNCLRVDIYDRYGANGGVFIMETNGGWANLLRITMAS